MPDDKVIQEDKPAEASAARIKTGGSNPQFLTKLLTQKVTLRMISGQPVTGELIGYNAYEILLKTPKGTFLIFKGAIAWIEGGSY
jgi:sRNA-binding regulator protein Hfq